MVAYYNEFKPEAAHMLRQLIKGGLIADGDVDERSITEVQADEIKNYTQCHFFAGIGGWSVALRLAGWSDDRPVWTGSCPCQPFSSAGRQKGKADERHLWPVWYGLIKQLRPATVFGEQVESAIAHGWLDDVYNDMEAEGYAVGSAVLPACAVGKPHQRKRLWFVAQPAIDDDNGNAGELQDANEQQASQRPEGGAAESCGASTMGNAEGEQAIATEQGGLHTESGAEGNGSTSSDVADTTQSGASINNCRIREGIGGISRRKAAEGSKDVADTTQSGLEGHRGYEPEHGEEGRQDQAGHFREADLQWVKCPDGRTRPVKRGVRLLAHGVRHRTPVLHAFGNAIVPACAQAFIQATGLV